MYLLDTKPNVRQDKIGWILDARQTQTDMQTDRQTDI